MPKDIRSYFSKPGSSKPSSTQSKSAHKDKKNSNDDVGFSKKSSKRRIVEDSSDDEKCSPVKIHVAKKINLGKLASPKDDKVKKKLIDVKDIFSSTEVVRVPKKKAEKVKVEEISLLFDDDEDLLLQTVIECENNMKNNTLSSPKKTQDSGISNRSSDTIKNSPKENNNDEKNKTPTSHEKSKRTPDKLSRDDKSYRKNTDKTQFSKSPKNERERTKSPVRISKQDIIPVTPDVESKVRRSSTSISKHNESTAQDDEDRHDRKKLTAILYQKYKNRTSVINPGSKPLPKGKPNCLNGLTFVVTGILESISREEASKLITDYGGRVVSALSRKTNYMVVGEEAGPLKLAKADEMNIKQLTEDDLFEMINKTDRRSKKTESPVKIKDSPRKNIKREKEEKSPLKDKKNIDTSKDVDHIPLITTKVEKVKTGIPLIKTESTKVEIDVKPNQILELSQGTSHLPWVEKYKPMSCSQIIGQQGAASNCVKLKNWLTKWHSNHNGTKKAQKPNPWAKNDDGSYFKAALLSGPPGIGKTTTVNLVCKELGLDMIEFNASDTRSKKMLQVEVAELLSNKTLRGYFDTNCENNLSSKHILVMDEVDGMAGNEDRGGIQELIGLIKNTSIPIICMCNDRSHQKMRSLVNYCYDLRYNKPRIEQIKGAMMSVLFREKFKIPPNVLNEIIAASNNDIRQTLNHLSLLSSKKDATEELKINADATKKDIKLGPWEVVRKVFSSDEHKTMSMQDKSDLFFYDYSMGPLFVQQNYLSVAPNVPKHEVLNAIANTADSLSMGDLIEKRIRSNNAWSLLPTQAMFSSVLPGEYMSGRITGQINFPGWLGKNSKTTKRRRLAQEVHDHTRMNTHASVTSFRMEYAPIILHALTAPLLEKGMDGVHDSLEVIKAYRLLREDIDALIELSVWPGKKSSFEKVESKVKAALTRAYNKEISPYSYTATAAIKKKRAEKIDDDDMLEMGEEGTVISDDEEDDKVDNDVMIKAKKQPAKRAAPSSSSAPKESKASTSKKSKKK